MTYGPTVWVDYGVPCIDAANLNNMEAGIDRAQGDVMVLRDTTANIPASDPLLVGRLYIETDLLTRMWRDNGAGWDLVPTGGGVWVYIAETILLAPAATVTFAAIPGTYRALQLLADIRTDLVDVSDSVMWRANADAGANYDRFGFVLSGSGQDAAFGAALVANEGFLGRAEAVNSRASCFAPFVVQWARYATVDREKTSIILANGLGMDRNNIADLRAYFGTSFWQDTAAITSLTYLPDAGANFVTGCRFALYGIT